MQIFLDCDGVLADFEHGCQGLLGMPSRSFEHQHGPAEFWGRLSDHPDFYGLLPLLADALQLFDAVRHLDPIILTGLPRGRWAEGQKRRWVNRHFPGTPMIACWSADKHRHAQPSDILVDDQMRAADRWLAAGGRFIHHRDAGTTIKALADIGVLGSAAD